MDTVKFVSQGHPCVAFNMGGQKGFRMPTCVVNFEGAVRVNIEYLPEGIVRVVVNDGAVWFDTSEQSAAEIEALFSW